MNVTIDSKKAVGSALALVEIGLAAAVVVTALISAGVLLYMVGVV
jgi:hypothetical protein